MANPKWFDEDQYFTNKLEQLQATDSQYATWTTSDLRDYFTENNVDPYEHFQNYGKAENVSPNSYFVVDEYLAYKADQLNATQEGGKSDWTAAQVQAAFDAAGLTAWDHYQMYGDQEGVNPSKAFDVEKYYEAKVKQLNAAEEGGRTDWTVDEVKEAFAAAGLTAVEHYEEYGKDEKVAVKSASKPKTDPSDFDVFNKADVLSGNAKFTGTDADDTAEALAAKPLTKLAFSGKGGDDQIILNGGAHSFGKGSVDGGDGTNTIVVKGAGASLDMSDATVSKFASVNLTDAGDQTLTMSSDQVKAFGVENISVTEEGKDTLAVKGALKSGGMLDVTGFAGNVDTADAKAVLLVSAEQLAEEGRVSNTGAGKIAVEMESADSLSGVDLANVNDVVLTGEEMDLTDAAEVGNTALDGSGVVTTLHFADDAIQTVKMNAAQYAALAEFNASKTALTIQDHPSVLVTGSADLSAIGSAGIGTKFIESVVLSGTSVGTPMVFMTSSATNKASWMTGTVGEDVKKGFFIDLDGADNFVELGATQYGLLANGDSSDAVKLYTADLSAAKKLTLGDSADTIMIDQATSSNLTVSDFDNNSDKLNVKGISVTTAGTSWTTSLTSATKANKWVLLSKSAAASLADSVTFKASTAGKAFLAIFDEETGALYGTNASASTTVNAVATAGNLLITLSGLALDDITVDMFDVA